MADIVRLLNNDEVRQALDLRESLQVLEEAYGELGRGEAVSVGRRDVLTPVPSLGAVHGFKQMGGVVPGLDAAAVRVDSDLLHWPTVAGGVRRTKITRAQNPGLSIGKENGIVLIYRISTGEMIGMMTDGELQRLRVGLTSALAAKWLSRGDARVVGLIGSGYQAETQLRALQLVRHLERVRVYSPNPEHRAQFAQAMSDTLGIPVEPVGSSEQAAFGADILVSATSSMNPTVEPRWVLPGMHVNCIKKEEIDADVVRLCDVMVVGTPAPTELLTPAAGGFTTPERGNGWWDDPALAWESRPKLAEVIAGVVAGRKGATEKTCYVGLGTGVQFAALGFLALRTAGEMGLGLPLPGERFVQPVDQR